MIVKRNILAKFIQKVTPQPFFSIVIPTFEAYGEGPAMLSVLLKSINQQEFKDFEVIVTDHSKSDIILEVVQEWKSKLPIHYFKNERVRGNSSVNMNDGIVQARGKYIKVMHFDDYFCNSKALGMASEKINADPAVRWGAFGFNHYFNSLKETKDEVVPDDYIYEELNTFALKGCPSVSFFVNDKTNYYDEHMIIINDFDMHFRLQKKYGNPVIIPETCVTIRVHENQVSSKLKEYSEKVKEEENTFKMKFPAEHDLLSQLANKYASDKGTIIPGDGKNHGPRLFFTPIYDLHFKKIRKQKLNFLEIGIGAGPSLKMWPQYFPFSSIHAPDILDYKEHETERVKTYVGNQEDRDDLEAMMEQVGDVDIIIDDGGHVLGQQQVSFAYLFKYLNPGGLYFIEDLHTSYWPHNEFKDLYNQPLDVNKDRTNTTVKMIVDYQRTGKFNSPFFTREECKYLNENVASCELFDLPYTKYGPNQLVLFKKV